MLSTATSFANLTITDDGKGGSLVSWHGGSFDVKHVAPSTLTADDFQFGAAQQASGRAVANLDSHAEVQGPIDHAFGHIPIGLCILPF